MGLIDVKGQVVLPAEYDKVGETRHDVVLVERSGNIAYYKISDKKFIWQEASFQ
jgi:hypothetical protein